MNSHRTIRVVLCAATLICNAGCGKQEVTEADSGTIPAVTVTGSTVLFRSSPAGFRTAPVEIADATPLALPGRLAWNEERTVRVYTPFSGRVVRILVRAGDVVKAGQPLAELASADFGQAQAEAAKASADLTLARQAAIYKAMHKMSYADCFAAALAKVKNAELLTGDPEFKSLEKEVKINWLK